MKKSFKIGFIGYGLRGPGVMEAFLQMEDVDILAVCDLIEERRNAAAARVKEVKGTAPLCTDDYSELLAMPELDAIVNATAWTDHIHIAIDTMNAGKAIAFEVGGAYSIHECWELVKTQERTKMPCMMLENSCYARTELAVHKMAREGRFGRIVHCDGAYSHDLRRSMVAGHEKNHYRLGNYINRNCDSYPTHDLGPAAKILNINRGNRMLTVSSMASLAAGLHDYIIDSFGREHPLADTEFMQGDIITTNIKCSRGETITLRLDTSLPRAYSRRFEVHGTKGMYMEDGQMFYFDSEHSALREKPRELWGNADKYVEENEHPLWKKHEHKENDKDEDMLNTGHGGTDYLVCRAFVESVMYGATVPIDVYDCAAWMCITALSEQSIALGGMPVPVPDFTEGRYITRKPLSYTDSKWNI